jgi:hypothetical protein
VQRIQIDFKPFAVNLLTTANTSIVRAIAPGDTAQSAFGFLDLVGVGIRHGSMVDMAEDFAA